MKGPASNGTRRGLSIREAAERLGVGKRTLERLIAAGEFPRPLKIGARSVVPIEDIDDYWQRLKERQR